mmetsp:Transcript_63327/g.178752  ORF Transcript_63327/g.178752 Transcript_63327/m.178752 type:complete len:410 (+) Transcript_63327:252-1481(+)
MASTPQEPIQASYSTAGSGFRRAPGDFSGMNATLIPATSSFDASPGAPLQSWGDRNLPPMPPPAESYGQDAMDPASTMHPAGMWQNRTALPPSGMLSSPSSGVWQPHDRTGTLKKDSRVLADELWQDARAARQQLDAKRGDLVTAMQALQQTEQTLREVLHDRQSKYSEIRLLRQQATELQAREEDTKTRLCEAHDQIRIWEEKSQASKRRLREAEGRCDDLEARLEAAEAEREASERRAEAAEREAVEKVRTALESEHQCELRATQHVQETMRRLEEADVGRQAEIAMALEELRAMSQTQQTLRSELRQASRPPRLTMEDVPVPPSELVAPSPYPSQKVWDAALEIARGRPSSCGASRQYGTSQRLPYGGGGSLLDGRVAAQAERIMAQVQRAQVQRMQGPRSAFAGR